MASARRARRQRSYDPNKQADAFKRAWLHHQRQPHHWQAWCVVGDRGAIVPLPMPQRFVLEMVADWYGAGDGDQRRERRRGVVSRKQGQDGPGGGQSRYRVTQAIQRLMLSISRVPGD